MKKMQIDRFEEHFAVLVSEDDKTLNIPRGLFPFEIHEGDILAFEWDGEALTEVRFLMEETEAARARTKSLMERLRAKKKK